jgi:hypothetical protein
LPEKANGTRNILKAIWRCNNYLQAINYCSADTKLISPFPQGRELRISGASDRINRERQQRSQTNVDFRKSKKQMLAAIRIETVLVVLVILNLIGLTIAAYMVMRRK